MLDWVAALRWRRVLAGVLVVVSLVVTPSIALPIYPPGSPLYAAATGPNPDLAHEVGWPDYVTTVGIVAASLPGIERDHTIVLTDTYELAAPLVVLRPADGAAPPAVFSAHNGFWYWGPPPESATEALVVGDFSAARLNRMFTDCAVLTTITTPPGVDNALTGTPIRRCTQRRSPWTLLWQDLARPA